VPVVELLLTRAAKTEQVVVAAQAVSKPMKDRQRYLVRPRLIQ
jgi:hypothetical protein